MQKFCINFFFESCAIKPMFILQYPFSFYILSFKIIRKNIIISFNFSLQTYIKNYSH